MPDTEFVWQVPADHPALPGHFPGQPIVPGVVLLDQAICFAEQMLGKASLAWRIGNAKFFSPARPKEVLTFCFVTKASCAINFSIKTVEREIASGSLTPDGP